MKNKEFVFVPLVGKTSACRQKEGHQNNKGITLPPRLTAVLPPQGREMRSGFTLIELLVVILIIGILAAVALPQYQKSVLRSRNAGLKQMVRAIAQAEHTYYLANGKYAAKFSDLDIDLPLTPLTTSGSGVGVCRTGVQSKDGERAGKDFYVALNSTDKNMGYVSVVAYWNKGRYQCAGFGIALGTAIDSLGLHCREMNNVRYTAGRGAFCEKIEHAVLRLGGDWRMYELP